MTLSVEASQEAALEDLMDHINSKWNSIDFTLMRFKDMKDTFILRSLEDVTAALEDSMVTMSTILASRQVRSSLQPHTCACVPAAALATCPHHYPCIAVMSAER